MYKDSYGGVYINTTAVTIPPSGYKFKCVQALTDLKVTTVGNILNHSTGTLKANGEIKGMFTSVTLSSSLQEAIAYY